MKRDGKNEAKETMGILPANGERVWFRCGHTPAAIRRKPGLLFD